MYKGSGKFSDNHANMLKLSNSLANFLFTTSKVVPDINNHKHKIQVTWGVAKLFIVRKTLKLGGGRKSSDPSFFHK